MQTLNFPINFPAYAYKTLSRSPLGQGYRYGAVDPSLERLTPEFNTLQEFAMEVVDKLLHLEDLPQTEEIPDSFCDLDDNDWQQLNEFINQLSAQDGEMSARP